MNRLITIDWLDIHFKTSEILKEPAKKYDLVEIGKNTVLQDCGHGTGNYAHLWDCYHYGELLGQLQTHPRVKQMKEESVNLKIDNSRLYCEGLIRDLAEFQDENNLTFKNVTRLDLAIDNVKCQDELNSYLTDKNSGLVKIGKSKVSGFKFEEENRQFGSFYVGSRSSDKFLKVYNKSLEILQSSKKSYISDFWAKNNVSGDAIYRLELQMRSKAIKDIRYFKLEKLASQNYLYSIFKSSAKDYLTFGLKNGKKDSNKSRLDRINLIEREIPIFASYLEKSERLETGDIYKAKLTIKLLFKIDFVERSNTLHFYQTVKDLIERYQLEDWYKMKKVEWIHEFEGSYQRKNKIKFFQEGQKEFGSVA